MHGLIRDLPAMHRDLWLPVDDAHEPRPCLPAGGEIGKVGRGLAESEAADEHRHHHQDHPPGTVVLVSNELRTVQKCDCVPASLSTSAT